MGEMSHHAIVVTHWREDEIKLEIEKAKAHNHPQTVNGDEQLGAITQRAMATAKATINKIYAIFSMFIFVF